MTAWWLGPLGLGGAELLQLFLHFTALSLLAIGGAITTAPDIQRFIVKEQGWLDAGEFAASIALAQSAPGPNVLFVAVIGFNVAGVAGALVAMLGCLLPSTTLTLGLGRFLQAWRGSRGMEAFTAGLAPTVLGLLMATAWILLQPSIALPATWGLVALSLAVMLGTRLAPLWLVGAGAVVGALGGMG